MEERQEKWIRNLREVRWAQVRGRVVQQQEVRIWCHDSQVTKIHGSTTFNVSNNYFDFKQNLFKTTDICQGCERRNLHRGGKIQEQRPGHIIKPQKTHVSSQVETLLLVILKQCNRINRINVIFISDLPSSVRELSLQLWPLREHRKLPFKKLTLQSRGMVYLNGILDLII